MTRLPTPGSDEGKWGQILNDYLSAVHNNDGTLKDNVVTANTIAPNTIDITNLSSDIQNKLETVAGPQDPTGATGPQGPQGAVGATGSQGQPGSTGAQGLAGTNGATGATGPAGQDGTSVTIMGSVANAAALPTGLAPSNAGQGYLTEDNGHLHVWSGTAWTDVGEIRGPQGATGPTGGTGQTGATGIQGFTGPQGNPGTTGATGSQGPQGFTGPTGQTGATGATGPTGTAGTQGSTGATGPAGATTIAGIDGLQGVLDSKVTGYNGLIGIWRGSQAEYDAITTKNNAVLYVINGA